MSTETAKEGLYLSENRHISMSKEAQKRPILISKETHRELFIQRKRLAYISKETYIYVRDHISKQTNRNVRRDLYLCQKRPIYMSKETYIYVRDHMSKETNLRVERHLVCQKRPKRDLHTRQKNPT